MKECKFCGKLSELREGGCWDCANAEAIIHEGLDMYDIGINGQENVAAKFAGQKLRLLIEKGWVCLSNYEKKLLEKPNNGYKQSKSGNAQQFLKDKGLKDTIYDVKNEIPNQWVKGGLSKLLEEFALQYQK